MEEKYTYVCADSNFSAYLQYLGYNFEIKINENENRKPNVVFLFEGESSKEFNNIFKSYRLDEIKLNLSKFIRYKDDTFRMVRNALDDYYNKQRQSSL